MNHFTPRPDPAGILLALCRDLIGLCAVLVFSIGLPLLAFAASH